MRVAERGAISVRPSNKIPIICICNDKYNQKLKSLQNWTLDMVGRSHGTP